MSANMLFDFIGYLKIIHLPLNKLTFNKFSVFTERKTALLYTQMFATKSSKIGLSVT